MANFEKLTDKPTRANMMKQIKDMDLDMKPKPAQEASSMSEGSRDRKKPNKYSVPRPAGMSLSEHKAAVDAARKKAAANDDDGDE